jgi:hypothetical protein
MTTYFLAYPKVIDHLKGSYKNITAYDLFAFTVVCMITTHAAQYFLPLQFLQLPGRIAAPIFIISVGYNVGHKLSKSIWAAAIFIFVLDTILLGAFRANFLIALILIRLCIEPLMLWALKNKVRFWGLFTLCIILYLPTNIIISHGTLSILLAMAGWMSRNRDTVPKNIVKPQEYFIYAYIVYATCIQFWYEFTVLEFIVFFIGSSYVFFLMYNFRDLIVNSLKRKPRDLIEKINFFLGHKSLQIYVFHWTLFKLIFLCAIHYDFLT